MEIQTQIIIGILISVFVVNLFYTIIGLMLFIRHHLWKKKNNLDIVICDLTRNGVIIRKEIGRRELGKNGWQVVTAKFFRNKGYKDNLGYNITEDDMTPSGHGRKRKFLLVAMKDGLTASLKTAESNLKWTKEELALLKKVEESFNNSSPIKLDEIPKSLSLKPILSEQTRLAIDLARDTVDVEGNDDKKAAKRMLYASIGLFVFTVLICFAMFIVFMTQGQSWAAGVAAKPAAAAVTSVAPGITLPG